MLHSNFRIAITVAGVLAGCAHPPAESPESEVAPGALSLEFEAHQVSVCSHRGVSGETTRGTVSLTLARDGGVTLRLSAIERTFAFAPPFWRDGASPTSGKRIDSAWLGEGSRGDGAMRILFDAADATETCRYFFASSVSCQLPVPRDFALVCRPAAVTISAATPKGTAAKESTDLVAVLHCVVEGGAPKYVERLLEAGALDFPIDPELRLETDWRGGRSRRTFARTADPKVFSAPGGC